MTEDVRQQLVQVWSKLDRSLRLLEQWDGTRGILLTSHDDSAHETVRSLAAVLTRSIIPVDAASLTKRTWNEETKILRAKERQGGLFDDALHRPCVVIQGLDVGSEWLFVSLKGLFEHATQPVGFIASANDPDQIPGFLASHFFICRKLGRARRKRHPR